MGRRLRLALPDGRPPWQPWSAVMLNQSSKVWGPPRLLLSRLAKLNGCFTWLLRIAHNVDWTARIPITQLYGSGIVPPTSCMINERTLRFAVRALRAMDQGISDLMLWVPISTSAKLSYVKTLSRYTVAAEEELKGVMSDRQHCRDIRALEGQPVLYCI